MITWIQKTFQQHFRIIFLVLLAGVIISFIFITNTSGGLGRGERRGAKRPLFGLDLSNEQEHARLVRDGTVSATLLYGGRIGDIQQFAFERRAMLHAANELRIPQPTEAELKAYIQTIPIFMTRQSETDTPRFDADAYNRVRKTPSLLGVSITPGDFNRILAEDVRIAAAAKIIAGPGYVLPSDVQYILKRDFTTWTLQTATIARDSFKTTIDPTDLDLGAHFENHRASFTIPPRVRVSYAEIPAALFASGITITDAEIRAYYDQNPARFPKPAAAPESMAAPVTPDSDFNLVKPQVELALRQQKARQLANKAASDLAYKLYTDKITPGSPEFARILIQHNATINSAPEFSENDVPAQFGPNRYAVAREALSLDADSRISNAIDTGASSIILFWEGSTPSREPDFAEVREKVKTDFIAQETQRQFTALGQKLRTRVQDALKAGSTFEQAATQSASALDVKITTQNIAPFSIQSLRERTQPPPEHLDMGIVAALENLKKGGVSEMSTIAGGDGRIVHVLDEQIPDLTETNPNYKTVADGIAAGIARAAAMQYQQTLVEAELAKSGSVSR